MKGKSDMRSEEANKSLQEIREALMSLDAVTLDTNLEHLYHDIIPSTMDADVLLDTSLELMNYLYDFWVSRSAPHIVELFCGESNTCEKKRYMLTTICDWMSNEMRGAINLIKRTNNFENSRKIKIIIDYIELHYRDKSFSLETLSQHFENSVTYIAHLFKKETHMTIIEYLTKIRIREAKKMLKTTTWKVYEVSEMVGYGSSQYFGKVFKKVVGMTPVEYRSSKIHTQ